MPLKFDLSAADLSSAELASLKEMRTRCARRILLSTSLAASGHPGGSLSSLDMLLVAYGILRHDPKNPRMEARDRFVASIGHISPGVYSVLAEHGYFNEEDFLAGFRRTGSGFPGHVESIVPGVEWDTGNLGQGLSTAVGMAHAFKLKGLNNRVFCLMGDGEQQKGQIVEAIRHAVKYKLDNLTVLIDRNKLQICGSTEDIMPQCMQKLYGGLGFNAVKLENGHDCNAIYKAMRDAYRNISGVPTVLIAQTVMGKGISFMENKAKYHGSTLPADDLAKALAELGVANDFEQWQEKRKQPVSGKSIMPPRADYPSVQAGEPIVYPVDKPTDCRSGYGNALTSLAQANNKAGQPPVIVGISCDLEGSVKMDGFHKHSPQAYLELGIQEHHAAGTAGAMSCENFVTFFSTFGSFAVSEVYNQNRLNDFNHSNVKVVATHVGLDVGEDGPTHQCIDYLGLMKNYFRFSVFMPADPNQTDRIIRHIAVQPGNHFVGMGRSKTPTITREDGSIYYDADYVFTPGQADWLREGTDATIITYGALTPACIEAWKLLKQAGKSVGVLNMASLLPLDKDAVLAAAKRGPIVTVEDHHVETGLGASAAAVLIDKGLAPKMKRLGVKQYGGSGKPSDLYKQQGLDAESIAKTVLELLG
ncbi:MAG: transketolase [Candidatus Electronema aureum]|uniref:Transketolase n=1 Tax=Candidatus Electronema aureum TaxID=2005002 RepID=A0A521FYM4_9BACT|nr:MAG: transketolase [Candidatus Electronema aureum]